MLNKQKATKMNNKNLIEKLLHFIRYCHLVALQHPLQYLDASAKYFLFSPRFLCMPAKSVIEQLP